MHGLMLCAHNKGTCLRLRSRLCSWCSETTAVLQRETLERKGRLVLGAKSFHNCSCWFLSGFVGNSHNSVKTCMACQHIYLVGIHIVSNMMCQFHTDKYIRLALVMETHGPLAMRYDNWGVGGGGSFSFQRRE